MRDAFHTLGLQADAGARDVKRAYARLLKTHRPDGDPVAFQRLNEAYEHALAVATRRERDAASRAAAREAAATRARLDEPSAKPSAEPQAPASAEPPRPRPALGDARPRPTMHQDPVGDEDDPTLVRGAAPDDARPPFAFTPFLEALEAELGRGGPHLLAWLRAIPALWSFELKLALPAPLVQALVARNACPDHGELDALAFFFGIDGGLLRRLRLHDEWMLLVRRAGEIALGRHFDDPLGLGSGVRRPKLEHWLDELAWRDLTRPADPLRRLMLGLLPTGPRRAARILADLERRARVQDVARILTPGAGTYWRDAGDIGRYARARLVLGATRLAGLAVLVIVVLAALVGRGTLARPIDESAFYLGALGYVGLFGLAWAAAGAVATAVVARRRRGSPG